ncbi:DUF3850 domain-containing protein [Solibacillus sp. FSL R7-0668]|uniref:DUF3850 domain-containing protein n=1 Tax=Solibacillus sp. FSL R7-0668 TaxID=2921688 RepID=UPI0030F5D012
MHELKILPEYFEQVFAGEKTFEIRKDDRGYQTGDLLHLKEFGIDGYTGKSVLVRVTYITAFKQELGYVVMAIKEPGFEVLNSLFGYDKAANLTMGEEPIWVLEQATDEDLEANIMAVDSGDVI